MNQGAFIHELVKEYEAKHDYWRLGTVTRHVDVRCMRFTNEHVYMLLSDGRNGIVGCMSLKTFEPALKRISTAYQVIRGARIRFHKFSKLFFESAPIDLKTYITRINKDCYVLEIDDIRFLRSGGLFKSIKIEPIPSPKFKLEQKDLDYYTQKQWAVYSALIKEGELLDDY